MINNQRIAPANRCIYCGTTDAVLTDEHIVPYALWGDLVFPKASCKECAKVTSRLERAILRGEMLPARTVGRAPTRRPKERPDSIAHTVGDPGSERTVQSRVDETFAFLQLPLIEGLQILDGHGSPDQLQVRGFETVKFGTSVESFLQTQRERRMTVETKLDVHMFALLLVRIGFAHAATTNLDGFNLFAPEVILRRPETACRFVGSDVTYPKHRVQGMHALATFPWSHEGQTYLVSRVWLFARHQTTPYVVVVGLRRLST